MKKFGTLLVLSCFIVPTHLSSMFLDNVHKKVNDLGMELKPKSLASSFFNEVDKCMEGGNVTTRLPVSSACLGSLFDLIYPMKLLTVRPYPYPDEMMVYLRCSKLGKMLDSWGKVPDGIFEGNTNWFGSYQQCNRVPNARYCLVGTTFTEVPYALGHISLGTCFPKKCTNGDVRQLLKVVENATDNQVGFLYNFCDIPYETTKGHTIAIFIISLIVVLSVVGTIVEAFVCKNNSEINDINLLKETSSEKNNADNAMNSSEASHEIVKEHDKNGIPDANVTTSATTNESTTNDQSALLRQDKGDTRNKNSFLVEFLLCFSLLRNTRAMTSAKVPKDSIQCINGVRVIIACVVMAGHMWLMVYTDDYDFVQWLVSRFWFMPIGNGASLVNVFFLLSGFLVAYLTLKWFDQKKDKLKLKDLFTIYLHRYIRLTPPVAIVILLDGYILPLTQFGPWPINNNYRNDFTHECQKYWWSNLLYFSNFYPKNRETCASWTWYIMVDTQLFVVSPLILFMMVYAAKKSSRKILGPFIVSVILICISFITRAYTIHYYKLPSVALFSASPEQQEEKDYEGYWDYLYVKPYTRFGPYIVGLFLGYAMSRKATISDKWKPVFFTIGWISAIAVGYLSICGPFKAFKSQEFSDFETLMYGTFHSVGVVVSFAWLIYACHHNMGGILNTFLSWSGWIPLGRISYSAYLVNPMLCYQFYFAQDKYLHYQENIIIFILGGIVVVSFSLGAMIFTFVEAPIANLEKILLSRKPNHGDKNVRRKVH